MSSDDHLNVYSTQEGFTIFVSSGFLTVNTEWTQTDHSWDVLLSLQTLAINAFESLITSKHLLVPTSLIAFPNLSHNCSKKKFQVS